MLMTAAACRVRPLTFTIAVALCVSSAAPLAAETAVNLERLTFARADGAYAARSNNYVFRLENPDSAAIPSAWDSALSVSSPTGGSACSTPQMLIEKVYFDRAQPLIVVVGYSGSSTIISFFGPNCAEAFASLRFPAGDVDLDQNRITVSPACTPLSPTEKRCWAGRIYHLRGGEAPQYSQSESLVLTRTALGVEFEGSMVVPAR